MHKIPREHDFIAISPMPTDLNFTPVMRMAGDGYRGGMECKEGFVLPASPRRTDAMRRVHSILTAVAIVAACGVAGYAETPDEELAFGDVTALPSALPPVVDEALEAEVEPIVESIPEAKPQATGTGASQGIVSLAHGKIDPDEVLNLAEREAQPPVQDTPPVQRMPAPGSSKCDECPPAVEPCCFEGRPCGCWSFRVGSVFLEHSRPSNSPIVTTNGAVGAPTLQGANQLNPSAGWGWDISAIRSNFMGGPRALEVRYFGVYGFNANLGPTPVGATAGMPFLSPIFVGGAGASLSTSYGSQLQSFEINSRRWRRDWLQLLVGVRYIDLTETMNNTFNFGGAVVGTSNVRSFNDLWGVQVGGDAYLWQRGRLSIDSITKLGIYDNNAGNSVVVTQTTGGQFKSAAGLGQGAFVAEAGLSANYWLTRNWALRTTYQMLWLDGVALAPEQVRTAAPTMAPGGGGTVATNNVFFNGFFLGVECRK
jgi:hypothetical protein